MGYGHRDRARHRRRSPCVVPATVLVVAMLATWSDGRPTGAARGVVAAAADEGAAGAADIGAPTVTLRLADDEEWEGAVAADVRAVLGSVVDSLVPHVPDAGVIVIEVRPRGGPIALFERAADGAVRVHLDTGGNLWSQYAYQFAHELCHVLCRFDRDDTGNRWFEEALCELASIHVLRRMAETWRETPPYPNWKGYSASLADYAERLVAEGGLPEGMSLADWYERHRDVLPDRPTDRDNARAIAVALLPLFEEKPAHWAAVPWLNAAGPARPRSFRDHLLDWRARTPARHTGTIDAIAAAFGVPLPDVTPDVTDKGTGTPP